MRDTRDSGFTLIELMVSVLILAILLAAAVPTFLGARRHAQELQARSAVRNTATTISVLMADPNGPGADPLAALDAAEPAYTYTYGPSGEPNQVSVAAYAGEIQLAAFSPGKVRPEVVRTAWLAVAASRSKSGACVIGVTHETAGTVSYVADDMKECRASLADPNDFAGLLKKAGHVGGWAMLYGPGCEAGCRTDVNDGTDGTSDPGEGGTGGQTPGDGKSDGASGDPSDGASDGGSSGKDDDKDAEDKEEEVVFDPGSDTKRWDKKDPEKAKKQWYETAEKICGAESGNACWARAYQYWEEYYKTHFADRQGWRDGAGPGGGARTVRR